MEKALRRRAGADLVDIDTFAGTCRFWYSEPRVIDFEAIERASIDASYKLVEIKLTIYGEIVNRDSSTEVVIPETGQLFELEGSTDLTGRLHLHTTVTDWQTPDSRLRIDSGHR